MPIKSHTKDFSNQIDPDGYLICALHTCTKKFEALYSSDRYCSKRCKIAARNLRGREYYYKKKLEKKAEEKITEKG